MKAYAEQAKEREKRARLIRAVTHGLISAYNIYNATQTENETVKNTYYFIGGVSLLAAVSFTF